MIAITNCHPIAIYILQGAENNRSIWFLRSVCSLWCRSEWETAGEQLHFWQDQSQDLQHDLRLKLAQKAAGWALLPLDHGMRKRQTSQRFAKRKHQLSGLPVYSRLFGNDFYILSPNCSKLNISHPWELTWHIMAQCQCQCPISESSCRADFGGSILVFQAATPDRILQSPRNQKIVKKNLNIL